MTGSSLQDERTRTDDPSGRGSRLGRLLARNMAYNLVGTVVPVIFALALLPVLTRGLGPERFGILALSWLVFTYLTDMGLSRATTKFVAEAAARADERGVSAVVATSVAVQAMGGLALGSLLAIAAWAAGDRLLSVSPALALETRVSLVLVAAAVPFVLVASAYRGVLEAAQRFDRVNAVRVPSSIANYVLPAGGVLLGLGLVPIIAALVAARLATAVAFAWLAIREEPRAGVMPRIHRSYLRPMVVFGGWLTLGTVLTPFLVYGDRVALAVLAGAEAVGYYAAPAEVVIRLLIIPASLVATLFPALSALRALDAATEPVIWRGMKYVMLLIVAPIGVLIAVGEPALVLWIGADFAREGASVLTILAVGVALIAPAYVPIIALQAVGRADITARLYLLELPIFVALLVVLIPVWGIAGAAAAWTARVALDAALGSYAAGRVGLISRAGCRDARFPQAAGAGLMVLAGAFAAAAAPGAWATSAVLGSSMAAAGALVWIRALDAGEQSVALAWLRAQPAERAG
jgi:O-antigen/teichoic acid export membrane protein